MNSAFSGELFSDGCLQYYTWSNGYAIVYIAVDGIEKMNWNITRSIQFMVKATILVLLYLFGDNRLSSVLQKPLQPVDNWILEVFRLELCSFISLNFLICRYVLGRCAQKHCKLYVKWINTLNVLVIENQPISYGQTKIRKFHMALKGNFPTMECIIVADSCLLSFKIINW